MSKPITFTGMNTSHWGSPLASYHPDFRKPTPTPNREKMSSKEILDYCEKELTVVYNKIT